MPEIKKHYPSQSNAYCPKECKSAHSPVTLEGGNDEKTNDRVALSNKLNLPPTLALGINHTSVNL